MTGPGTVTSLQSLLQRPPTLLQSRPSSFIRGQRPGDLPPLAAQRPPPSLSRAQGPPGLIGGPGGPRPPQLRQMQPQTAQGIVIIEIEGSANNSY